MSHKNNVNPDHYKVAGRGRQGEDLQPELEKAKLKEMRRRLRKRKAR